MKKKLIFIILGIGIIVSAVLFGILSRTPDNDFEDQADIIIDENDNQDEEIYEEELVSEDDIIGTWYSDDKEASLTLFEDHRGNINFDGTQAYTCKWEPAHNGIDLELDYPSDDDVIEVIDLETFFVPDQNRLDVIYENKQYVLHKYIPEKIECDENGDLKPEYILGQWGRGNEALSYYDLMYFRDDNTMTFYTLNLDDPDGELIPTYNGTWEIKGPKVYVSFEEGDWEFYFKEDNADVICVDIDSERSLAYGRSNKGIIPE